MRMKHRIGLVGAGNMGTAILDGLLKKAIASPRQVYVYDKVQEKASSFCRKWRARNPRSVRDLVQNAEIILLAIKPQDLLSFSGEVESALSARHLLISILAGTPISKLRRCLGIRPRIVRAMPNLGAKVGASVTAVTGAGVRDLALAGKIFLGCGVVLRLKEKDFDLVTAVSGSGPAYFFLMMELLAQIANRQGLSRKNAELLAVQTALGAGLLARGSPFAPGKLREMVTSKKGTTDAALKVLMRQRFPTIFEQAVLAALERGRELSQS